MLPPPFFARSTSSQHCLLSPLLQLAFILLSAFMQSSPKGSAAALSHEVLRRVTLPQRSPTDLVQPLCSLDAPLATLKARSLLDCAQQSTRVVPSNASFNFHTDVKTCDVYESTSDCFSAIPYCQHYQVGSAGLVSSK